VVHFQLRKLVHSSVALDNWREIEDDIAPLLTMQRVEQPHLLRVNASLFTFDPVPRRAACARRLVRGGEDPLNAHGCRHDGAIASCTSEEVPPTE
jgi:hypothetical protein